MLKKLTINKENREIIAYPDASFPLEIWTGHLNEYLNHELPTHWHEVFEFAVILSGSLTYTINDETFYLNEGDCIFVNSNVLHTVKQYPRNKPATLFTIGFLPTLISGTSNQNIYNKYFYPIIKSSIHSIIINQSFITGKLLINTLKKIYLCNPEDNEFELSTISLLCELWKNLRRYMQEAKLSELMEPSYYEILNENRIKHMLEYIHQNYEDKITIEQLAETVNISKNACFRCFKRYLNKTPIEYIKEYRLNRAAYMLLETDKSLTEISMLCGFNSSSYFGKLFKENYGIAPLQYRNHKK